MTASSFRSVDEWIFDLDNTLYPAHTNLFAQIDVKITNYVQRLIGLSHDDARTLQKGYYQRYGTTLRGLMLEHDIKPDAFLEFVHDIDHSALLPDPRLGDAIARLPGRKFIMTNGTRKHAESVAAKLGITDHFSDIFGIVEADLLPKPHRETYDLFLTRNGIHPGRAAMFEDLARNLEVPGALGMRTVLIVPDGTREVFREAWELENSSAAHIEHVTDDLTQFLEDLMPQFA
ncbi:pyrimidine 5'-nucleotidase [Breoghania sp. L-A4]|uniref:pyrimidine 5'-nucleotidase n=1 Tax=Breoghania sp. L-A4 TaxID=2304600 RepID=UPI000E35D799|nr:pyrimidine 5'-nucleotidase [Breoghania sp. L-A4]AXS39220.1 pyrimidine 5'-nucleotidase [Breoghania sp. L-A4]